LIVENYYYNPSLQQHVPVGGRLCLIAHKYCVSWTVQDLIIKFSG